MAVRSPEEARIAVVGLGYVGLPLAIALARKFRVVGFDVDQSRIDDLGRGEDRTGEVTKTDLRHCGLLVTADIADIAASDIFIVAVPTPVDAANRPDLSALRSACRIVGGVMRAGAVVVFESTVYPGVTEDVCGPDLARASGLVAGKDFFLGYSPERINPGDRDHAVHRIPKVVAGQTAETTQLLAAMYGAMTTGGVFVAKNIKTAEAAKVIENAQRDINIAFVNEVTQIVGRLDLSIYDVLDTAQTKWNFLPFRPGLVGGHCIGVDPYYLAYLAQRLGHEPEVVLAGRRINDAMGRYIAGRIAEELKRGMTEGTKANVLILGLTFKEDVRDLRNSKVADLVAALEETGLTVQVHDPLADPAEAVALYGIDLVPSLADMQPVHCVVGAVTHQSYRDLTSADLARLVVPGGLVADIKGMWRQLALPSGLRRWQL
ncbi:MAG: nucleotide sugar dehydrogenase [Rhodospirillales bacterium]|nr:nucleotide sugar dehydrogenase [Rhodospirillales bacterium]